MYKKIIIFILFSFSASILYSQEYYRSNSIGMAIEKIKKSEKEREEYLLVVVTEGSVKHKTLYKKGDFYKKWEIYFSETGETEKEVITEKKEKTVLVYNNRHLAEEYLYSGGILTSRIKYVYSSAGKISAVEYYDSNGRLTDRKTYSKERGGKLTEVRNEKFPPEGDSVSSYSFSASEVRSEWQGDSDGTGRFFFYRSDRVFFAERWDNNRIVSRTDYIYNENILSETVEIFFTENRELVKKYDERRRVVKEIEKSDNSVIRTVYNTYNGDNLVKKIINSSGSTEKYLYNYNESILVSELYYLNGNIKKKTYYDEENDSNYYEDLYSDNIKYMRIYYRDNEKYKIER